ncbi:hypothetical protein RFI_03355 [Reticulomyxa filosa]|uniref:Uncharacterized protein n=1 Tax=Reticulomyxa filosa TaxID=46433 RepID=X6P5C0_RETFI|nr:hypothetical protein RFI_03355 [Reticulomyxa filosa]|eukprot:ETO33750.1 hypothetical protein RFI_03355 [Reticulomyxa filosa]
MDLWYASNVGDTMKADDDADGRNKRFRDENSLDARRDCAIEVDYVPTVCRWLPHSHESEFKANRPEIFVWQARIFSKQYMKTALIVTKFILSVTIYYYLLSIFSLLFECLTNQSNKEKYCSLFFFFLLTDKDSDEEPLSRQGRLLFPNDIVDFAFSGSQTALCACADGSVHFVRVLSKDEEEDPEMRALTSITEDTWHLRHQHSVKYQKHERSVFTSIAVGEAKGQFWVADQKGQLHVGSLDINTSGSSHLSSHVLLHFQKKKKNITNIFIFIFLK